MTEIRLDISDRISNKQASRPLQSERVVFRHDIVGMGPKDDLRIGKITMNEYQKLITMILSYPSKEMTRKADSAPGL